MRPVASGARDKENDDGDGDDEDGAQGGPPVAPTGARQVTEFFSKEPPGSNRGGAPAAGGDAGTTETEGATTADQAARDE